MPIWTCVKTAEQWDAPGHAAVAAQHAADAEVDVGRARLIAAGAAVVLLGAGCTHTTGGHPTASRPASHAPAASLPAGASTHTITLGGAARTYRVYRPATLADP